MQKPNYVYVRLAHDQVEAWTEGQLAKAAEAGKAPDGTLYKYVLTTERFRVEKVSRVVPLEVPSAEEDDRQAELPIKVD